MQYIVFDLEWNQGNSSISNKLMPFEIIEIGAVKLDENLCIKDRFHRIIKPVVYTELFEYTRDIISLEEKDLETGIPFEKACCDFLDWCQSDDEYFFATWGTCDLYELQRNMAFHNIKNEFPRPIYYYNIQYLFTVFSNQFNISAISLENAVNFLNIKAEKSFHSAIADAEYTAAIFNKISSINFYLYPSVDLYNFPLLKSQEVSINYPDYGLYISSSAPSRERCKQNVEDRVISCHICGKKLLRLVPWHSSTSRTYSYVGLCTEHGLVKVKKVIKNPQKKHFFATITTKFISNTQFINILKLQKKTDDKNKT